MDPNCLQLQAINACITVVAGILAATITAYFLNK